jgi:hypothetical protein
VLCFTTLGYVDPRGETVDGVARLNFVADSRSGTATVTCWSGGAAPAPAPSASPAASADATATGTGSASITIAIGSSLPTLVVVTADPQRLASSRQSSIAANVFDQFGNPVQNVPVVFSLSVNSGTALEETLDSGGAPQFTDSNGRAFDTLRTRAVLGGVQKSITVTATTANKIEGTTTVFVN